MINWTTLCIDADYNGRLAGEHLKQAEWDVAAQTALSGITYSKHSDRLPEQVAVDFLNALYANPRLDTFMVKEPFTAFHPQPGVPVAERIRRQLADGFQKLADGYLPTPLSPSPAVAAIRQKIRVVQLSRYPEFQTYYCNKLSLPVPTK